MGTGKMLINKSHENFTNVSFHISTIRGIEPNNLSLASLMFGWTWNICDISLNTLLLRAML